MIRQLMLKVAGTRGHRLIFGDPEQLADQLEKWLFSEAADGFHLMFPIYSAAFEDFVKLVVPALQIRGIYRKEYEGTTFKEYLGLSISK
jgi:alkanesulfonate monooxygenase SsuD/methylene tetrahydromethanopterin reductase-like flavin-dependent oxidoreductase (luciferase family)